MTKLRTFTTCALAICSLAALAAPAAHAGAFPYPEPAYTKTNGNNAFWFHWKAETGVTAGGATSTTFYTCANTHRDSTQIEAHQGTNGPGAYNCTGAKAGAQGDEWWIPGTSSTVLDDGHYYSMCVSGWHLYGVWTNDDLSAPDNCARTTIDRNKPAISVGIDGDKTVTNDPNLQLSIGYQDATSPPWFGQNGIASNWTCISRGGPCQPSGAPDADCSVPTQPNSRLNAFYCQANVQNEPDGDYYFCAYSADAAMPDNPSGTNQLGGTSNQANLSGVACGYVTLDRAAPAVSVQASNVNAPVGTLIDFSGQVSDPSGLQPGYDWDFGDNTQHGTGASASHTYTQPGTYKVTLGAKDSAGNAGSGSVTVTITKAGSDNPPPPPPDNDDDNQTPDNDDNQTPDNGDNHTPDNGDNHTPDNNDNHTPDDNNDENGTEDVNVIKTPDQVKQGDIAHDNGGPAQNTSVGSLDVIAPKRFTAGRKKMTLALTPDTAGKLSVSLLKGSKIVSTSSASFAGAGTYQMKLGVPKKLKPGAYKLKLSYTPEGATKAQTKTLKVKVVKKKKGKRHAKVALVKGGHGPVRGIHARTKQPR